MSSPRKNALIIILLILFTGFILYISDNTETISTTPTITTQQTTETIQNSKPNNEAITNTTNASYEAGVVTSVTDGDTLKVVVNSKEINIRLIGIDSPEINHPSEPVQCYGIEAKDYLTNLVLNKKIYLEKDISDTDIYDRFLRYIWLDNLLINEKLIVDGYAFSSKYPPDTKYQNRLDDAQVYAKDNLLGLWNSDTCNGDVYTDTYKDTDVLNIQDDNQEETGINKVVPINTASYACNCSKTCGQMVSCDEAYFQLNACGCSARDGDDDGVPCESIC